MEKNLDRIMEEVMNNQGVFGCIFADQQGLSLGVKGKASTDSAGVVTAIVEQAAKLDPTSKFPVIHFENNNNSCIINKIGDVTVAVFKSSQS